MKARQKKRVEETHAKKLNDLLVAYVFSCKDKSKKESKEILSKFNHDWVVHCHTTNKYLTGTKLNPIALKTMANDKKLINLIEIKLGLQKPKKTFLQKILTCDFR